MPRTDDPLVTECPGCSTRFRVTRTQLGAAGGRVRCGACLHVFDGAAHLVGQASASDIDSALDEVLAELTDPGPEDSGAADVQDHEPDRRTPAARPPGRPQTPVETGPAHRDAVKPRGPPPAPQPAAGREPAAEARGATPRNHSGEDTHVAARDTGSSVPKRPTGPGNRAPVEEARHQAARSPGTDPGARHAEPGAVLPGKPAASRGVPTPSADLSRRKVETSAAPPGPARVSSRDAGAGRQRETQRGPAPAPEEKVAREPVGMRTRSPRAGAAEGDDAARPANDGSSPPARPPLPPGLRLEADDLVATRRRRGWLAPLLLLGAVGIGAQILWYQFDDWGRDLRYRPYYGWLCGLIGCELPELKSLDDIVTRDMAVRVHPDGGGRLRVDAVIVNTAPFDQAFPVIEVRFTTIRGQLVAGRRFEPDAYLAGELAGQRVFPRMIPVRIELTVDDPGPAAVNYRLDFR